MIPLEQDEACVITPNLQQQQYAKTVNIEDNFGSQASSDNSLMFLVDFNNIPERVPSFEYQSNIDQSLFDISEFEKNIHELETSLEIGITANQAAEDELVMMNNINDTVTTTAIHSLMTVSNEEQQQPPSNTPVGKEMQKMQTENLLDMSIERFKTQANYTPTTSTIVSSIGSTENDLLGLSCSDELIVFERNISSSPSSQSQVQTTENLLDISLSHLEHKINGEASKETSSKQKKDDAIESLTEIEAQPADAVDNLVMLRADDEQMEKSLESKYCPLVICQHAR